MKQDHEEEIAIFNTALGLDSAEARGRYLDRVCGEDADRRRRIEGLLRAYEAEEGVLGGETVPTLGTCASALGRPEEEVGAVIGRYKLLEKIGEGGFGVVYMAEQREPVKRRVALKIIKLGMDTRQVVARFEAERQALAMMDHPHIAKVLDGGTTDSGRPYFVMELVRGLPITQFCDESRLTIRDRLQLFISVCQALQHAHQKGIIHRDIKPNNILVSVRDDRPFPKVIDFGIAKATEQELTEKTLFTRFQQFIGTPAYMSPEQAQWSGMDIDTRSDVYSLGVLLYELLTGSPPLNIQELRSAAYDEVLRRIREEEPVKPSTRISTLADAKRLTIAKCHGAEPEKLGLMLRGDLDWIVMKALEKDRTRRYPTANDFAQDIQRFLGHEPVSAAPPSALYRFQRFARRHRRPLAAAAAVAGLLVAGTILSSWLAIRAAKAQTLAEEEAGRARTAQQAEAAERQRAEASEASARRLLLEARHAQGRTLLTEAHRLKEAKRFFEANVTAAQALGFEGFGRSASAPESMTNFPPLLQPGSPEEAQARLFIQREPDFAPLWRSGVARHHPDPLGDNPFRLGESPLWQIAFTPDNTGLLTKLVSGIRFWDCGGGQLRENFADSAYAALSPNGDFIVSSAGRHFSLLDPQSKRILRELDGSTGAIVAIASGPAAEILALALATQEIRLFDLSSGAVKAALTDLQEPTDALALDPSGRWLAFAGPEAGIQIYEIASGQIIRRLEGDTGEVGVLAFNPAGSLLAAGGGGDQIRVWTTDNWNAGPVLAGHSRGVSCLAFHPDRPWLVSGGRDHAVRIWNLESTQLLRTLAGHDNAVEALAIDSTGRWLASGCGNGVALMWDLETGLPRFLPAAHSGGISSVRISPDGTWIASGSYDRTVRLWLSRDGSLAATLRGHLAPVQSIDFSPDGRLLASLDAEAEVRIWDVEGGQCRQVLSSGSPVRDPFLWIRGCTLQFSPDGRYIAARYGAKPVLWDVASGEMWLGLDPMPQNIIALAWDPSGSRLAVSDVAGSVAFWRLPELEAHRMLQASRIAASLTFTPDGTQVVRPAAAGFEFVNFESGNLENTVGSSAALGSQDIVINPRGTLLAAAGHDSIVRLWSLPTGNTLAELRGHQRRVTSLDLAPDESFLVSGGLDGSVILWDLSLNRARLEWRNPDQQAVWLSYDPKGHLVAAHSFGNLEVRDVGTGELLAHHANLLPVSPLQWSSVVGKDSLFLGTTSGELEQWDPLRGRRLQAVTAGRSAITQLALDRSQRQLAAYASDHSISVWDTRNLSLLHSWDLGVPADSLEFLPDGARLAITGGSGKVEVWDVGRGVLDQQFEVKPARVSGVAFNRTGDRMVTGGDEVRLWNPATSSVEFESSSAPDILFVAPSVDPEGRFFAILRLTIRNRWAVAAESAIELRELASGRLLTELSLTSETGLRAGSPALEFPGSSPVLAFGPDGRTLAAGWLCSDIVLRVYNLDTALRNGTDWASYAQHFRRDRVPPDFTFELASTNLFTAAADLPMRARPESRFLRLLQDTPSRAELLPSLFWTAYHARNGAAAVALWEDIRSDRPAFPGGIALTKMLLGEARSARWLGLIRLALRHAEQATRVGPENAEAWAEFAELASLEGRSDRALEAVDELARLQPDSARTWRLRGEARAAGADPAGALEAYAHAINLSKPGKTEEWSHSLLSRADTFQRLGRLDEARTDRMQGLGIPERDSSFTARQLDLTLYYDAALNDDLHGLRGNHLQAFVPQASQPVAGIAFDARGVIHLRARHTGAYAYPKSIKDIPVNQPVQRLHVLHAAMFDRTAQSVIPIRIAEYVLHYSDGTAHAFPVDCGVHLAEEFFNTWYQDQVEAVHRAGLVWEGENDHVGHNPLRMALFAGCWTNPHPEKLVTTMDLISAEQRTAPYLLGITVD